MPQFNRHDHTTRTARAVAASRDTVQPAAFATLILSLLLVLLTGAVWTQLT